MAIIDLVFDEVMLQYNRPLYIKWNTDTAPHMAISGITGTGKTYLVKLILARISKNIVDAKISICDFKGYDFSFLHSQNSGNYYRYDECIVGFNNFYDKFIERLRDSENKVNPFQLLVFDEWASYLNYLDKKNAEDAKKKLATLLMLGRSYNFHVMLSQQRLDAEYFGKSRDNFNVIIYLGNVSKETEGMLFSNFKDSISPDRSRGTGYITINGSTFKKIVVPTINNMDLVNEYIRKSISR